jgi:ribosomal protein S12 methylthiotransferase
MIRKTTSAQLRAKLALIKRIVPDITLRSTVIVGFPGETEEHFKMLLDFVQEVEFDHLGVFAYSREEYTPAAKMKEQLPEEVKQERVDRLAQIQEKIALRKRKQFIGKRMTVLVDGFDESVSCLFARTEGQAPEIDDVVYIDTAERLDKTIIGGFVPVTIVEARGYDFIGEVVI